MEDAGGPSRNADRPSQNDDPTPDVIQHHANVLTHIQTFLPYLDRVINGSQPLEIVPDHAEKLQYLHNLVATKSFSPDRVENSKIVFCELYNAYSHQLNYCFPPDLTTSGFEETKFNGRENNISSDGIFTSNKTNQNQNRESALPYKRPISGNSYNILNSKMGCINDLNTKNKEVENVNIDKSYFSKNSINDSMLAKNKLQAFSESRLRINKIIGCATNASIEKLMESNASILHTELPTQIFDEMPKNPKNGPVIPKDVLKSINVIDIDMNYVKEALDAVKQTSCVESIKPPLPSQDLMNLGASRSFSDLNVPRDPKVMRKSLLSSEKKVTSLTSNGQNTIQTPFTPNTNNSNPKSLETKSQEMSNGQGSSNHTNIQLVNPQVSSEHYCNSIKLKNKQLSRNQNKYDLNFYKKNDNGQFRNSVQMHGNPSRTKPLTKYCDPVPHTIQSNDASKRHSGTLKSVKTTLCVNHKEYREGKNRQKNKGFAINKNQIKQGQDKYPSLVNKKMEKNNIIGSPYNTFGAVNETATIKFYKIPKLKTSADNINNTTVLKTNQKSKSPSPLKANTIKEQHLVNAQKKSELKKSNKFEKDLKITDKMNDSHTDKHLAIEVTKNSKTEKDRKIKTIMKENENDSGAEINLEETIVNIPNKVIKGQRTSKSEQNSISIDSIDQNKLKNQKNCSKEKKLKKIIKDGDCTNNDIWGPSRRTRSSVRQQKILENLNVNNSKPKFVMDIITKNDKKLESGECIKNYDSVSIPVSEDDSGRNEIRHNIISSPSKEQSRVVSSTTAQISCKSQQENMVSTNGINSTADYHRKVDNKTLIDLLKNPEFIDVINIFRDENTINKIHKLNKLLESSDVNTNDVKLKQKGSLNKDKLEIDKKKMVKETKKNVSAESSKNSNEESKNKFLNCISDNNNFNQAVNSVETKKKKSHLNELIKESTSFGSIYDHSSTGQHKLKYNESYGNFEILKDGSIFEEKQLKIVIPKFDGNIKGSENCNADTSTNGNIQTNNKPINDKIVQEIKSKKPFVGPLSVKLARQKMELSVAQNKRDIKNQLEFETGKVRKRSKSVNRFDKKEKLDSELSTSLMIEQPIVLVRPFENNKSLNNITDSNKLVDQNTNASTYIVNSPKLKMARPSELDKLCANKSGMFDCEPILNASTKRQCRTNKKIDYVNTNEVSSKEKETSNIEESELIEDKKKFIYKGKKPKNIKNQHPKSTIVLNKKKQLVKKSMANKTGNVGGKPVVRPVVKPALFNKVSNKKFKKEGNKKIKKSNEQYKVVLCDGIEMNNVLENEISTKIISKVVTKDIYKDKLYFQTSDNSLECKFCSYKDKGLNIVRHYKYQHCGEEVLPSRLPENCAKSLILQSLKENFQENTRVSKPICHQSVNVNMDINYTCVFCQFIFQDYFKFYVHITGHTGEYRYKCKMCEKIYSNEDDLENHILEHTDYDKTDGISRLIFPNIIWGEYVFGYLCSFCYYVQLDYNNIVKHMASQHFDEDNKLNSHWTVIRISMSMADKIYINSLADFDNLVGCLPPIQSDQVISKNKDNDDQNQKLTITDLNARSNELEQPNSLFSIEKKCNEQTIDKIELKSIIDESTSEPSFSHVNPPVSVNDKFLPELNMLQLLPEQVNQSPTKETRISTEQPEIQYSEYTLKEKSKKCTSAGLSYKPRSSSISNICDMSVSKSLSDDINSISKNVNLNINHGSNDKKLPLSSLQISDVESLKKRKVNTSKINSNASDNDDLSMWMKSNTYSEVVVSNSETFLEAGQQIVNNGVSIDGKIFLIDTAYTKDYIRKVRDFSMSVMKTQSAFNEMSALPRLLGLFKCMDRNCTNIYSSKELFKLHMATHFSNAEKTERIQMYNVQQFKMCAYCFKTFDDEESLANHIAEKYTFCEYFCPHCFYRAYTASHVFVHQSVVHTNIPKHCILKLQYDDGACEYPKEELLVVDFKEFVLPYKCNVGCCGFSCYLHHEFLEHLNLEHQQCDKFCCYICADKDNGDEFFAHCPILLIKHLELHNLNKYQCIFCLFGSEIIDSMIKHLAFEHFEYDLLCLERSTVSDDCESKNIKNLKMLRLKKVIDKGLVETVNLPAETFSETEVVSQQPKKRFIECPDVLSIGMKSARFDEGSQPPDAIVRSVPDSVQMAESSTSAESLVHNNEFIITDDDVNQNDMHVPLKITRVWSEFLNNEKKSKVSSNDIIVIDDEDDVDLSEVSSNNIITIDDEDDVDLSKVSSNNIITIDDEDDVDLSKVSSNNIITIDDEDGVDLSEQEKISIVSSNDDIIAIDDEDGVDLSEQEQMSIVSSNDDIIAMDDEDGVDLSQQEKISIVSSNDDIIAMDDEDGVDLSEQEKKSIVSSNNDIIAMDDEDGVDLSEQEKKSIVSSNNDIIAMDDEDGVDLSEQEKKSIVSSNNDIIAMDDEDGVDLSEQEKKSIVSSNNDIIAMDDEDGVDLSEQEKKSIVSSNNDIIAMDDEDGVDLSEQEKLNDGLVKQEESINESNERKQLVFPIELDKLFICKKCEIVFSNGKMYCDHLKSWCPSWNFEIGNKCIYCFKYYKKPKNLTEHMKIHGPNRFNCVVCHFKLPTQRAITRHMKKHKIINLKLVPDSPNLTDLDKDYFTVFEDKGVNSKKKEELTCNKCLFKGNVNEIISHMMVYHSTEQNVDGEDNLFKIKQELPNDSNNSINSLKHQQNEQQNTRLKIKRFTNIGNRERSLKAKPVNQDLLSLVINNIPKSEIFSHPISCLLCTYTTKLRSKLVKHLNEHAHKQCDTTKEIVNPVPTISKFILMSNKMINLSSIASDAMNTEKVHQVVGHQHNMLLTELNKNSETIVVDNKRKSYSPTRKNNIAHKKRVLVSQLIPDPVSNDNIIDLVDDSDTNN